MTDNWLTTMLLMCLMKGHLRRAPTGWVLNTYLHMSICTHTHTHTHVEMHTLAHKHACNLRDNGDATHSHSVVEMLMPVKTGAIDISVYPGQSPAERE